MNLIDYPIVLERMRAERFVSLYHNSGAFGFGEDVEVHVVGWLGPADETIRSQAKGLGFQVIAPYEENLARLLGRAWGEHLRGCAWVMPMSHWSYELEFGSREWMPQALQQIGIDPATLITRNNAAAIEFELHESELLEGFTTSLLHGLQASDFAIVFPGHPALCTLHHHKQLWWQTKNADFAQILRQLPDLSV